MGQVEGGAALGRRSSGLFYPCRRAPGRTVSHVQVVCKPIFKRQWLLQERAQAWREPWLFLENFVL